MAPWLQSRFGNCILLTLPDDKKKPKAASNVGTLYFRHDSKSEPANSHDLKQVSSSGRQSFASLRSGRPIQLPPPSKEWERDLRDAGDPLRRSRVSFVGAPRTVAAEMREFVERTQADELMVVSHIYDQSARLRSYEIAAATMTESPSGRPS